MSDICKMSIDTNKSNNLSEEALKKYSEIQYQEAEKKMDLIKLCNITEQRCKAYGCKLQKCLGSSKDTSKCQQLFRQLNFCIENEKKKYLFDYLETGKQPTF